MLNFELVFIPVNRLKFSLGMVNFTNPPQTQAVVPNVRLVSQMVNSQRFVVDGRWACWV